MTESETNKLAADLIRTALADPLSAEAFSVFEIVLEQCLLSDHDVTVVALRQLAAEPTLH